MLLEKISLLEDILEEEGYLELLMACKTILGSDGGHSEVVYSVNEEAMAESSGYSRVYWLKYKITILENLDIFREKSEEVGLHVDRFLAEINQDVQQVEDFLLSL